MSADAAPGVAKGGASPLLVRHPSKSELAQAVGARLVLATLDALAARGRADLVLTGGSMGAASIEAVVASPLVGLVDFSRVHLWWGDERYRPAGDAERNDTQADGAGLARLGVPVDQVHRVATSDASTSLAEAAQRYDAELAGVPDGFDVVLLGVGDDGHVASLFPGHPAQLASGRRAVAVEDSPKPPPQRVSLTLETLASARQVWFLVSGSDKAGAVADGLHGAPAARSTAGQVRGPERTLWLTDEPAASSV